MRVIDCLHLGRERVIGCWQVGEVLIDPGPESCLETLLAELGDQRPRALLLTHIHLDHAGSSGSLVARWPDLEVYVHENGAPHMADPSRLLRSVRRLYGEDMDRLWGDVVAVPEDRLRVLKGGERLRLGGAEYEVAYTPGHAWHHVSYLYEGTAFVGDVGGVRIVSEGPVIPPTPPPDIDLEAWHGSLELIAAWKPERLAITHFGSCEEVAEQLDELSRRLDLWAQIALRRDEAGFATEVMAELTASAPRQVTAAYLQAAPVAQMYAGLRRYWQVRGELGEGSGVVGDTGAGAG
jgi:glyoxylase-like metal-dependent hydrolase (beta-lactamase superfamily II)